MLFRSPGNVDLAVKGNYLYADSYSDLVVFDISHPSDIHTVKFVSNVFPYRSIYYYWGTSSNPDSINVVVDYIAKDTTVQCDTYNRWAYYNCPQCDYSSAPGLLTSIPSKGGTGGSMARFAVINNNLYTVSNSDVSDFDIADAANPQLQSTTSLGTWNAETIFPFNGKLFIGSSNGMFIYDVSNASTPVQLGQFSHVRSCDPVIADNNNAFVTLRSGTVCQGFSNQMEVMDIANLTNPVLLKTYSMTNPHGLSKDGNWLFVCDGTDGLKVYDAADVNNIQLKKQIPGIETYDVIATNNIAMVVAADGLYQFNYSDINNIQQLSKIAIEKN